MRGLKAARLCGVRAGFALVALLVLGWPHQAVGAATPPFFATEVLSGSLGNPTAVWFNMSGLYAGGDTERITIAAPAGFPVSLVQPAGTKLGTADLSFTNSTGGDLTSHSSALVVLGAQAWAANAAAQSCAPGSHTATWSIVAPVGSGTIEVPIAVDRSGPKYTLTVCFDALYPRHLVPEAASFTANGVFATPTQGGRYFFDGIVTPYASDGKPDPAQAYEFRSYEIFPGQLVVKSTYDPVTHTLSATGTFAEDGLTASGVVITIYAGAGQADSQMKAIGTTQTGNEGEFSFSKKLAQAPRYSYAVSGSFSYTATSYDGVGCVGVSRAARGCIASNIDGTASIVVPVTSSAATATTATKATPALADSCNITQSHSLAGKTATTIEFANNTLATVKIYWLNYSGQPVYYHTLGPGESYAQATFDKDPWIVLNGTGACVGYVVAPRSRYVIGSTAG